MVLPEIPAKQLLLAVVLPNCMQSARLIVVRPVLLLKTSVPKMFVHFGAEKEVIVALFTDRRKHCDPICKTSGKCAAAKEGVLKNANDDI